MIMSGIVRLGRDAEIRFMPDQTAVANLAVVFNFGAKQADGNRLSQWVDASIFGKRAESLAPYLLKGSQIGIVLEAPHIETFKKQDGTEHSKLVARVLDIELISGQGQGGNQAQPPSAPRPQTAQQQRPQATQACDNFGAPYDDDIPF